MKLTKVTTHFIKKEKIGSQKDFDQYYKQIVDRAEEEVAQVETEKYIFSIVVTGEQRVFDEKTNERIKGEPERFLELYQKDQLVFSDMCWLEIDVARYGSNFVHTEIVISSVKEAIEVIENLTENEIEEILQEVEKVA